MRHLFLAGLMLLAATPPAAQETPGTVERKSLDNGAREIRLTLPGRVIDLAFPHHAGGGRDLVVLVKAVTGEDNEGAETEEAPPPPACLVTPDPGRDVFPAEPLKLVRFSLGSGLETMEGEIPQGTDSLAIPGFPGNAEGDLLLIRPGELRYASGPPVIAELEEGVTIDRHPSQLSSSESPSLFPVTRLGSASFYEAASPTEWTELTRVPIPVRARRAEGSLRLESPLLQEVGRPAHGRFLWAVGPEAAGRQRLRTLLVDPAAPDGTTSTAVWSRLPEPEIVMESGYALLDGRPVLITLTRTALKLAIFEEKFLRIFYLDETDRSRTGNPPAFAFETGANLWQAITPFFHDMDGDASDDLVLGYWKGLKDDRVVLDTYLRNRDGSFKKSPRTTEFDVEDANRSVLGFGIDLDGDGFSELLLRASGAVRIYQGRRDQNKGKKLFDKEPRWSFQTSASISDSYDIHLGIEMDESNDPVVFKARFGGARIMDLEGDGRNEVLLVEQEEGRTVVRILRL